MCCKCHRWLTCLSCARPFCETHHWDCPEPGAYVTEDQCCQKKENHDQCKEGTF